MWTGQFVLSAVTVVLGGHTTPAVAKPGLEPGTYFFSYYANPITELRVGIIRVEEKDGKLTASTQDGGYDKTYLHEFVVTDGTVSATITFGPKPEVMPRIRFEGRVNPTDPKQVVGEFWIHGQVYQATFTATTRQRFASQAEHIVRLKAPAELSKVASMRWEGNGYRYEAEKTDKPDEKRNLLAAAAEFEARRDAETARLLRKVVEEHPGTPAATYASSHLIELAGRIDATPDEVRAWAKTARAHAAKYGPRLEKFYALQTAEALVKYKGLAPLALSFAEEVGAAPPTVTLHIQALRAQGDAQETMGRGADAARSRARAEDLVNEAQKKK